MRVFRNSHGIKISKSIFSSMYFLSFVLVIVIGYVKNILILIDGNLSTVELLLRLIGIILLPLGSLMGFM